MTAGKSFSIGTVLAIVVTAGTPGTVAAPAAQSAPAAPLFRIFTGDFWLNLHHYLYVLGRAEAKLPDAARRAVAGAPGDQATGLATLAPEEREAWLAAVREYAAGPSLQDPVFDKPLIDTGNSLAGAGDTAALEGVAVDPRLRATLERAAPIYRKAWWPAHRASNERWKAAIDPLIHEHAAALVAYVTRAYGMPWPSAGYPVRVVAFSNWAGAFSTTGPLLVMSSYDSGNTGLSALETVLHESMHQWDDPMWALLLEQAKAQRRYIPADLTHAMTFFTAGEAVRARVPGYVPYAATHGIWERGMGRFRPALDAAWLPWLGGEGTRDAALAALVKRVPEARGRNDIRPATRRHSRQRRPASALMSGGQAVRSTSGARPDTATGGGASRRQRGVPIRAVGRVHRCPARTRVHPQPPVCWRPS